MKTRLASVYLLIPIGLLLAAAAISQAPPPISAAEAKAHIGETRTVCGRVASAKWDRNSRNQATFLNLDKAYPDQIFTIVIWSEARKKFSFSPEEKFRGQRVCVKGAIRKFHEKPEIVVDAPSQLWLAQDH